MKKVILLALLMPFPAFGQIIENFESGSIVNWVQSTEGHWKADTTMSLSGTFSLHHIFDNPDAGTDKAGIRVNDLHPEEGPATWTFLVRHGYDPSSQNNWSVFLMSDIGPESMSTDGTVKGFATGVNLTGSDDTLRLWKINGNQVTTVVNSHINWQADIGTSVPVKILILRTPEGNWTVTVTTISGDLIGTSYGIDDELFSQGWFGVYYRYSSTRDCLLWLDNIAIEGIFHEDHEAPVLTKCESSGKKSVVITLNEEPEEGIMIPENISLNAEDNRPVSVEMENALVYNIEFNQKLNNRTVNILKFNKLCDNSGNCSQNVKKEFTPVWAETGDIVISEIMADPLPEVSLPGKEYIEITNRTGHPFNLKNWRLSTAGQYTLFPERFIPPYGIIILCNSSDTLLLKKYGTVIGMKQFPSLTDGGRLVYLCDSTGNIIHGVEYSDEWYKDELKSQGGWSLEMIDTGFPFFYEDNWIASESKTGGTPGSANSVSGNNPDISFEGIQNVYPDDSATIHIRFSEPVFNLTDMKKDIKIGGKEVTDILPADPLFREFSVKPGYQLQPEQLYNLEISDDISDFAGNRMQKCEFNFGIPETAEQGDILFNEVLFNPLPGDPDYLELYNRSGKVIDASRLRLISVSDATGDKSVAVPVSSEIRCILPGQYYAITTDKKRVAERYFSTDRDHLFETSSLPSMPDDKGYLILYNRELDRIDELHYTDDMQYSLLSTNEGVALEKTDPNSNSEVSGNWHSAAESSGWGTPGAPNSVFNEVKPASDKITLSSSRISPDGDGNEDFLTIKMMLKGNGNVVSVTVFDETGNYVREIATNLLAGNEASVIWDGTAADGSPVKTGIYIILINLYDDAGKTATWKKVCTVIRG